MRMLADCCCQARARTRAAADAPTAVAAERSADSVGSAATKRDWTQTNPSAADWMRAACSSFADDAVIAAAAAVVEQVVDWAAMWAV